MSMFLDAGPTTSAPGATSLTAVAAAATSSAYYCQLRHVPAVRQIAGLVHQLQQDPLPGHLRRIPGCDGGGEGRLTRHSFGSVGVGVVVVEWVGWPEYGDPTQAVRPELLDEAVYHPEAVLAWRELHLRL